MARTLHVLLLVSLFCRCGGETLTSSQNHVTTACLRASACWIQPYPRVHACLDNFRTRVVPYGLGAVVSRVYDCVNRATTCTEMEQCFGAGELCNSTFPARCDGDTAIYCDLIDGITYAYDCGSSGLACQVDPLIDYAATCVAAREATVGASSLRFELECSDSFCERTGEACNTDELDRCDDRLVRSCVDGEWVLFDCEALGLRPCVEEDNGYSHCYRPE